MTKRRMSRRVRNYIVPHLLRVSEGIRLVQRMVEPVGWVERGDIPITSSRQHADVPACRRNFIAGCGFCFERLQVVQQGDGFRKGSTHPMGSG